MAHQGMLNAFDEETAVHVAGILMDAHVDTVSSLTGDSRLGNRLRLLPPTALRSNLSFLAHYTSMAYMAMAHKLGHVGGEMKWDHPAPGTDVLEWEYASRTFKFRRTGDENETPARSGHVRKSERHNAGQMFLIEPEPAQVETGMVHWLICSGFDDGPNLDDILSSRFFAWTAPFLANNNRMIGERQMLFSGEALTLNRDTKMDGVSITKPLLTPKEKEIAVEEFINRSASGQ
jgi:hypothetical protein